MLGIVENVGEIAEFLESNKDKDEIKEFTSKFYVPEKLNPFLESEAGKKIIQPKLDGNFSKGLETWKANNLQGLIDKAVTERFPAETEDQKRLKKMEKDLQDQKSANLKITLTNKATDKLLEYKMPVKLAKLCIGEDEASTMQNVEALKSEWNSGIEAAVDAAFKEAGRSPRKRDADKKGSSAFSDQIRQGFGFK